MNSGIFGERLLRTLNHWKSVASSVVVHDITVCIPPLICLTSGSFSLPVNHEIRSTNWFQLILEFKK